MPLVFQAAIVWAVGTAIGLRGLSPTLLFGPASLLALWLGWRTLAVRAASSWQAEGAAALSLLFAVAVVVGAEIAQRDAQCAALARAAQRWQVRLGRAATPSAFVTGIVERVDGSGPPPTACRLRVAIVVRNGSAVAGSLVRVTRAEASWGERGLLLRDATLVPLQGPGALARWRSHVAAAIERRFGADAGLAKALLIADTEGLTPDLRERYADAGLVHILSISGLHVGIIGAALLLLVEAARLPATAGRLGAVLMVGVYVLAIGAPAAAVRSAALFSAVTATRLLQRPTSPWATFALAALLPLVQPRTVLDLGWQLSVTGYAGLIAAGRLAKRSVPRAWRGWRASLLRELLAGLLTTLATGPLIAWHFGRLSLVAVISNLGAGPVVALLQPTLFLAMLAPGDALGSFVADAARPMLGALDAVASAAAAVPGAAVSVAPTLVAVLCAGLAATAVIVSAWARHWAPWATTAGLGFALLLWVPDLPLGRPGVLEVHVLDVGQGDAIALRTPAGRWVLVDAGRSWSSGDAGRTTVIPYLRRHGGALALFVLTHPHSDHAGGAASVIRGMRPAQVRDAAFVVGNPSYAAMLSAARARGSTWDRVRPGERLALDGVLLEFLAPDSAWTAALDDPNEASTILRVQYGSRSLLLTGDAEAGLERWLLTHAGAALDVDVLKVAHHGSITSSTPAFLEAVSPRIAVVSVGRDNTYGHPSTEVMQRLLALGATVLRTDQLGTLILRTDGARWEAQAAGHRWRVLDEPPPLP
jgi:competence protein ComEC